MEISEINDKIEELFLNSGLKKIVIVLKEFLEHLIVLFNNEKI